MFGLKKPHLHRPAKQNSVDPRLPSQPSANPFDSDDEIDKRSTQKPSKRTSSEPSLSTPNSTISLFDDNEVKGTSSSSGYSLDHASRNKYKNDFVDSGGIENQSTQELEHYAAYKAEETTKTVNSALKIAEDIREGATNTMIALHQQGEQINRTHMAAADIEQDLGRGEKLLGSLGGIFSRTWKPKKGQTIKGPTHIRDDPDRRKGNHLEQREKLGLTTTPNKGPSRSRTPLPESSDAMQKVEYEKGKQDDGLSDLSDILGELKEMAVDMGSEIERQNKALNPLQDDIEEINFRVKGANQRTRRLLGK
ncbi:SNAP25 homologous protein SNAP33-like [Cynara cardunculus var. scolymus]|uniref:SNAP25 homologous protein SNAP33-like n=1 Tax=Cynara cardunculus var. scolymus TaxID=59895 RepID=UPI000D62D837|nr:SNAP25 homologous protein SNAP33-like [Cynara cardunculus var. scolymus]